MVKNEQAMEMEAMEMDKEMKSEENNMEDEYYSTESESEPEIELDSCSFTKKEKNCESCKAPGAMRDRICKLCKGKLVKKQGQLEKALKTEMCNPSSFTNILKIL